jgi:hypothetical protein
MSGNDDLQNLWQQDDGKREDAPMWRELIQEKRSGWRELVKTEDQAWYLMAACLSLLTGWAAWKARYFWVQVGYGLMVAGVVLSAILTWISSRQLSAADDRSLREDLESLIESYDRRKRFLWSSGWAVMLVLSAGMVFIALGIPGNASEINAWVVATLLVAGGNVGQWIYFKQTAAKISRKRAEAAQLLQALLAGPQGAR